MKFGVAVWLAAVVGLSGCKTTSPDSDGAAVKGDEDEKGLLITGKAAESLFAALGEGDRLQNDNKARQKWAATGAAADEGYILGGSTESISCERRGAKHTCRALLKRPLVRSDISRVLVAGQISVTPNPVTAAEASALSVKVTEWLPPAGPIRVSGDAVMIEGGNSGWKLSDFNHPVYAASDAQILCGSRGVGLSDTACLFAVKGNEAVQPTQPGGQAVSVDLTRFEAFSFAIQNVLFQANKKHPQTIGSKTDGAHGRLFFYKGQDATLSCYSFKCDVAGFPWRGDLALALRDGMRLFDVKIIGVKESGPSITCEGSEASPVCHFRFEENPLLALQGALRSTSASPGVEVARYNQAQHKPEAAKKRLEQRFAKELPDCESRTSASGDTVIKTLRDRAGGDTRVNAELKRVAAKINTALMVVGKSGEICSEKAIFELYHADGYKILVGFEK